MNTLFALRLVSSRVFSAFSRKLVIAGLAASLLAATSLGISSCASPVIQDYIEDYSVQGYLIVGEPIRGITLAKTGALQDSFALEKLLVRDADVRVYLGSREYRLSFRAVENGGTYALDDSSVTVQPDTTYRLVIRLTNGRELKGQTRTPQQIEWAANRKPKSFVQYPRDTTTFTTPDSLRIAWKAVAGVQEYLISNACLDTLEYGKYFLPSTGERNRRTFRPSFLGGTGGANPDRTAWGFAQSTASTIGFTSYRWFGKHEITVFAPDANLLNWFKLTRFSGANPQYNPILGSIEGGVGVFGSTSVVRGKTFLLKNQP